MKTVIVIPARYNSSRLPGKPLLPINGKPMLKYVIEAAHKIENINDIYVATDDNRILQAVEDWGYRAIMTSSEHKSGTDRLIEVSQTVDADIYINLQGDEPLINVEDVSNLVRLIQGNKDIECASLCHMINEKEAEDINSVKVVLDDNNKALYFSRSKIPFNREKIKCSYYKHIGVYAYRVGILNDYPVFQERSLEAMESLEQLRLLSKGIPIHMLHVNSAYPGVDTKESLEMVERIMQTKNVLEL